MNESVSGETCPSSLSLLDGMTVTLERGMLVSLTFTVAEPPASVVKAGSEVVFFSTPVLLRKL